MRASVVQRLVKGPQTCIVTEQLWGPVNERGPINVSSGTFFSLTPSPHDPRVQAAHRGTGQRMARSLGYWPVCQYSSSLKIVPHALRTDVRTYLRMYVRT